MAEIAGRWFRVSSDAQDEQNQETRVDAYIAARGYEAGPTYRAHDMSASKREHLPLLREMLADMRAGKLSILVMRHTDRIDRTEDLGQILRDVKDAGGRIESVDEPWLAEVSGLSGKLMTSVTEWTNAEYTRKLAANVRDAQAARRAAGSWCSGKAPYGYAIVGTHADGRRHETPGKCVACYPERGGRKTLEPIESEAEAVAVMFDLAAQGQTCLSICRALEGTPSREGLAYWSEGSVNQILRNKVYRGIVEHDGKPYMTVPALVPEAAWLQANRALQARSRSVGRGSKGRTSTTLLRPVCGRCGGPMYKIRFSYVCFGKGPAGNSSQRRACSATLGGRRAANTIKLADLDPEVLDYFAGSEEPEVITDTIEGTDYAEEIAAVILARKDLDDFAADYDERHAELTAELRRLRALPVKAPEVKEIETGRSEGDAFADLDPEEQRAWLRARYVIRVYPEPIIWQGRATRWVAGHIGERISEAEAAERNAAALEALRD